MKVLLDQCVPRKLKSRLSDHDCGTVPEVGLAGKKNGELLPLAESLGFEILLTTAGRNIAITILSARSNSLAELVASAAKAAS